MFYILIKIQTTSITDCMKKFLRSEIQAMEGSHCIEMACIKVWSYMFACTLLWLGIKFLDSILTCKIGLYIFFKTILECMQKKKKISKFARCRRKYFMILNRTIVKKLWGELPFFTLLYSFPRSNSYGTCIQTY